MATVPNDSWFYAIDDRPIGPVTGEQLRAAVQAGVIRSDTMVHNTSWPGWCKAHQVSGLIPNSGTVPAAQTVIPTPAQASPVTAASPSAQTSGVASTAAAAATSRMAHPPAQKSLPVAGPGIQVTDRARSSGSPVSTRRGRRRNSSPAAILMLLGALAACIAAATAVWVFQPGGRAAEDPSFAQPVEEPEDDGRFARDAAWRHWARSRQSEEHSFGLPDWKPETDRGHQGVFETDARPEPRGRIDELVFAKWEQLGIEPANRCSDAVFLRRAYLDLIGTLPTAEEAREFLKDESPDKREKLIDHLLERPEYADFWAMRWSDVLRVKAEFPINLWPNAAQAYHRYIYHSMAVNKPYDQFVRELLTSSGSNFRNGEVNFYRALQNHDPATMAKAAALAFMGERAEGWPQERLSGMAGFFAKVGFKPTREWKEEIVIFDPLKTGEASLNTVFPDGTAVEIPWDKDPRVVFADWLITPENPWFTRQIVNRLWFWLLGRGIVHEADDIRPDNPPSNPELLDYLAEELVRANYDMKHICRLILNSSTYQLSCIPKSDHPEAEAHFASYPVRRLEAEVIIDAINQITGTTESYSSIIPEPYTFVPENIRAISLPDGSIISSFLELFGRPPRDTGFLAERNNSITAGQRLHLLNSSHIRNKIRNGPGIKELTSEGNARENLYLAILSRFPGSDHGGGSGEDLAWMLINTTEFLFRH